MHANSGKWIQLLTKAVGAICCSAGALVGEMAFSTSCKFLEFWFQGSDSKSKTVVKVFVCHTEA